jgi:hypothetical protein
LGADKENIMTLTEKAELLNAVAEMTKANNDNKYGAYASVQNNCRDVANLILESIKKDFEGEKEKK